MPRTRYRFLYRAGQVYVWQAVRPVDSRFEQITVNVDWFWSKWSK